MIDFSPKHDFFIGVDSDGCVFDTMEVKHKECFIPNIIQFYGLAAISKYAREAGEFVNLYSKWRGINRFPALFMTMDLLNERPEVQKRGVAIPELRAVRAWAEKESKLGNPALEAAVAASKDPELAHCLAWSKAVNVTVSEIVKKVPPFPLVRESLEKLAPQADILVISATPNEALTREWEENELIHLAAHICGQEIGTKKETLTLAAKYPKGRALMIGDAPGDLAAARANHTLFYPINPGAEDASWERFYGEAIDRFFAGSYAGEYEDRLIEEFDTYLPETPPWKR